MQTHLEPLERTLAARAADVSADLHATREIERLVRERTGREPSASSCSRPTQVASCSSRSASRPARRCLPRTALASELEEELRQRIPDIADVVIHTEA